MNITQWKSELIFAMSRPEASKDGIVEFRKNGKLHNIEFPARIKYYTSGNSIGKVQLIEYMFEGVKHRPPCDISNGNGKLKDRPALLGYARDGRISSEYYYINGLLHRLDGPAYICNEILDFNHQCYHVNGLLHRLDGPAIIGYYPDGNIKNEQYYVNGVSCIPPSLIKSDKEEPVKIEYYQDGNIENERYLVYDKGVRLDGNLIISYYSNGIKSHTRYYIIDPDYIPPNDGLTSVDYYSNGNIKREEYRVKHKIHRNCKKGPAIIEYYPDGTIEGEWYYNEGRLYRPYKQGPSITKYYPNGKIHLETYYKHSKFHRPIEEGPARRVYDRNGDILSEEYWENDKLIK